MASDASDMSSSTSCRIVVISHLLERAADLIHQIHALSATLSSKQRSAAPTDIPERNKDLTNQAQIPWTIINKYYNASVHFFVHTIHGLAPYVLTGVPAVIFVWSDGEDYKQHILRIGHDLGSSEPEVALAVRLPRLSGTPDSSTPDEDQEDSSEIDDFLSSHGFEFIDVVSPDREQVNDDNLGFSEGVPSLPRVLDALSTIMWSSMRSAESSSRMQSKEKALLDWSQSGSFDLTEEDMITTQAVTDPPTTQLRAQRQMAELARWLEEDDVEVRKRAKDDPWQAGAANVELDSPTEMEFPDSISSAPGFDDDFTVFVSAPASSQPESTTSVDPNEFFDLDSASLVPPHSGSLYRSLGSQSDLSDMPEDVEDAETDEEDDGFPTKAEIRESAVKLFGPFEGAPDLPDTFAFDDNNDDSEFAAFDISRVLGALDGMKAEIAAMENEDDRRKAAAKVALGLVYGLEKPTGPGT